MCRLPLRNHLGPDATDALVDLLDERRRELITDVTNVITDRFERRLIEETSKLRVDMAQGFSGVRQEMAAGFAMLRQEMAHQKFDILKWVFLFWVGQFFAVASLMVVFIRVLRSS